MPVLRILQEENFFFWYKISSKASRIPAFRHGEECGRGFSRLISCGITLFVLECENSQEDMEQTFDIAFTQHLNKKHSCVDDGVCGLVYNRALARTGLVREIREN